MADFEEKKDCIFNKPTYGNRVMCTALNRMYCREEECGFYKSGNEYDAEGNPLKKKENHKIKKGWC